MLNFIVKIITVALAILLLIAIAGPVIVLIGLVLLLIGIFL